MLKTTSGRNYYLNEFNKKHYMYKILLSRGFHYLMYLYLLNTPIFLKYGIGRLKIIRYLRHIFKLSIKCKSQVPLAVFLSKKHNAIQCELLTDNDFTSIGCYITKYEYDHNVIVLTFEQIELVGSTGNNYRKFHATYRFKLRDDLVGCASS